MSAKPSDSIPGVDDQQLAAIAGLLPKLPNIGAESADRFAQEVLKLVEHRAQRNWPNEDEADLVVFVKVDYPRQVGEKYDAIPFVDPIATGDPLLGRLFFANQDASHGRFMPLPTKANAILEWLDDNDLGNRPIVIAYRSSKKIITRRSGTRDTARSDTIRDQEPSATLSELREALEHFHQTRILTPMSCPDGVWEPNRARQYIPGPKPEKSIQSALESALSSWFRGIVRAECEDSTNIGRIDVRLLKKSEREGSLTYWVIMELKIIKSFTNPRQGSDPSLVSTKTNIDTLIKGVKQAGSYQENRSAEKSFLEIYDLRKDKKDDLKQRPEVSQVMRTFSIPPEIHVWPVFGSSEDARAAGYRGA